MSLQHLPLEKIKESDLQQLITDGVRESRVIDYKREWHLNSDGEKREFLADVSSFANAGGGDLVYGVAEKEGVPQTLVGLPGFARDSEQLRAEEILARGVAPRLAGTTFACIALAGGQVVFIIRIARSWSSPHMVTANEVNRFYARHSNGKYQMDVNELRSAFLQTSGAANRIRDFRLERVNRIAAGDLGLKLYSSSAFVLHLIPLAEQPALDVRRALNLRAPLRPMGEINGMDQQMTLDGLMTFTSGGDGRILTYVQLFRNGAIEAVLPDLSLEKMKLIQPDYENSIRLGLNSYLATYRELGVTPPFFVAVSLLNVAGATTRVDDRGIPRRRPATVIDRPHLLLPEIEVDSESQSVDAILKPTFDLIWNACGYFGSPNFDEQSNWRPQR
jgi:hypothetical protein